MAHFMGQGYSAFEMVGMMYQTVRLKGIISDLPRVASD